MDQQLFAYIDQELKRGVAGKTVKKALADAGWESNLVEEAFVAVLAQAQAPSPELESEVKNENDVDAPKTHSAKKTILISVIIFAVVGLAAAFSMIYFEVKEDSAVNSGKKPNPVVDKNSQLPPTGEPMLTVAEPGAIIANASTTENSSSALDSVVATSTTAESGIQLKDSQRKADMQKLVEAQKAWFAVNGKYYTCGLAGGDCGGKVRAYPAQIPGFAETMPQDPSGKTSGVCGNDYVYCGLNNAPYPNFFCYYAKLENGGYYTASHGGNFVRNTPPKIFEECAAAN